MFLADDLFYYSLLKLLAGLANAAFIDLMQMVSGVVNNATNLCFKDVAKAYF